jgi:hypothetical protein
MNTVISVKMLQAVAMTAGIAILLWSTGVPTIFRTAEAASISSASDTISDSSPSTAVNHTIEFQTPNGMLANQTFLVVFPGDFTMGSVGEDDVDILVGSSSSSTAASNGAGVWGVSVGSTTLEFTAPSDAGVASSTWLTIRIGDHATDFGAGSNQIVNPAATTSYPIQIGQGTSTMQDSGEVRVAIIDSVLLTAAVDTSLTFTVSGVAGTQTVNSSPTTTVGASTATTLPFGTLPTAGSRTLAQDLSVATNASNGFSVTVEQDTPFQSTTGGIIDGFIDGANTFTPTAWVAPSGDVADVTTYGHWAITSDDATTSRSALDEFDADEWSSASTSPIVVMGHTGPSDGLTAGEGLTRVGYQVGITPLQEAGDDYEVTLRYIATPTF